MRFGLLGVGVDEAGVRLAVAGDSIRNRLPSLAAVDVLSMSFTPFLGLA